MAAGHASHEPDAGRRYHRIIGFYADDYVRVDGAWLFAVLRVTVEEAGPYAAEDGGLVAPP
jgi:hypothetical protein